MSHVAEETLHRIFDRLGGIDAKLAAGKESHEEFRIGLHGIRAELGTINQRLGTVETLAARIPVIEPTVWELEGKRRETAAVNKFFGGVLTRGRAAVGIFSGSVGAALTAFMAWFMNLFSHSAPPHP